MPLDRVAARVPRLRAHLRSRRRLMADGLSEAGLRTAVNHGQILRILPGRYVSADDWRELEREDRHLLRAIAVEQGARKAPLFSHFTSAILHDLPLLHFAHAHVHVSAINLPSTPPHRRRALGDPDQIAETAVIRHNLSTLPDADVTTGGIRHTLLPQTVIDVARAAPFAAGVVCADAGLRRLVREHGMTVEEARSALLGRLEEVPRARWSDRAQRVLRFASALAESPLESLTRLQLARLGFDLREQVPVRGSGGAAYRMDFELTGRKIFVEADGRSKYSDARMRGGLSAEEVVFREKRREDSIRNATQLAIVRSLWADAQHPRAMTSLLRGCGVEPPNPEGLARADLY